MVIKALKKQTEFENKQPEQPVFVVGNGPSLDSSLAFLKKNSDDIIIISCGTAIRALLKNNIKPDLHIEMERIPELVPIMEEVETSTRKLTNQTKRYSNCCT